MNFRFLIQLLVGKKIIGINQDMSNRRYVYFVKPGYKMFFDGLINNIVEFDIVNYNGIEQIVLKTKNNCHYINYDSVTHNDFKIFNNRPINVYNYVRDENE